MITKIYVKMNPGNVIMPVDNSAYDFVDDVILSKNMSVIFKVSIKSAKCRALDWLSS